MALFQKLLDLITPKNKTRDHGASEPVLSGYIVWDKDHIPFPLSKHFMSNEMTCHCSFPTCVRQKISIDLLKKMEQVREQVGGPILVTSAYRCKEYQAALRSSGLQTAATVSQHELGNAADLTVSRGFDKLVEAAKGTFKAVGFAKNFVHVDTRNDKVRHWNYT